MKDVDQLRYAYAQFVAAARNGSFAEPDADGWNADMVLAHVVVGDRLIAEAAARVMAGGAPRFDNAASQVEPYLQAVIQAAGSRDKLVEAVKHGGDELIALAERMTDDQAAFHIPARIFSGGEVVADGSVPVGSLVLGPAMVHLRLHSEQLAALSR